MSSNPESTARSFDPAPETARGRATYRMLLAVHARIRRDLDYVRDLAAEVAGGLEPERVNERLTTLKDGSILWRLQIDCLRYCGFVHSHHNAEDSLFFPELRATNPEINPVVDKLEADHRRVSDDLDAVEAAARLLLEDDGSQARQAVVDTLGALEQNLIAHLDYEELNIEATVLRLPDSFG